MPLPGPLDQLFQVGAALFVRQIQTELGQFDRHITLNAGGLDGVKGAQVNIARVSGLRRRRYAFAQVIERD